VGLLYLFVNEQQLSNMKVLFVFSGNKRQGISPITKSQGISLESKGIKIDYFPVKGKGMINYLKNLIPLRTQIKKNKYDIIHSHYSFTAILSSLATGKKPLIISLMGSDVEGSYFRRFIIKIFLYNKWNHIIVKSESLKAKLRLKNSFVIPNGVDLNFFVPIHKVKARNELKLSLSKKYILFMANPKRPEKNYKLAYEAISLLNRSDIELITVFNVDHKLVPYYLNASDVLLVTSIWEGSPNVVKEAMACNCPVVSTDVGDVKEIIEETENCYITSFNVRDIANKIEKVLINNKRSNGRKNIKHLDSKIISNKLIDIYNFSINKHIS
jgi:glycosyltransferase involved in cell wall biosynthesis